MTRKSFEMTHKIVEDMLDSGVNPFNYYTNYRKKGIRWWLEYRRFVKYLKVISPSFRFLWSIADFLTNIELLYMYHNDESANIHTVPTTKNDIKSFRINNRKDDFYIEYTLYRSDSTINIKLKRGWGSQKISEMTFPDGGAIMQTRFDEILMHSIINWTMEPVQKLFVNIYKTKVKVVSNHEKTKSESKYKGTEE